MLLDKDITKTQEIKTLFQQSWKQPEFFAQHLKLFKFSKSSKLFNAVKKSGIPFWELMKVLLVLPFMNIKNVGSMFSDTTVSCQGQKDSYYRALSNQKLDWRNLLLLFVKRYLVLDDRFSAPQDAFKCLIFDDSDLEKRGKKIEGISKIHNHVSQRFIFGYKILVAGYWNGSVMVPVDFSLHRENKDNKTKKYGLSKKERKKQKTTNRNKGLPVCKRFAELNKKKSDLVVEMFKRINQRKIHVDYILFDSWFTSLGLIEKLRRVAGNVHVIGMYKYNSKLAIDGREMSIKQLRKHRGKMSRSRAMRLYYFQYTGKIDDVQVKVFLTKRGVNGAWHTLLSTDTGLSFHKAIEVYNTRWTIEVFFKEAKQLLGLGKSQSTNFDVQVAQTTITMIQYLMVSLKYRMEAYETIGGMFREIKQDYIEHKLNERLLSAISEILSVLELITDHIDFNEIIHKLILNSEFLAFLNKEPKPITPQLRAA